MTPKCFYTDKLCSKHLNEEVSDLIANGAAAVTILNGRILHVNGLNLLIERNPTYSEECSE